MSLAILYDNAKYHTLQWTAMMGGRGKGKVKGGVGGGVVTNILGELYFWLKSDLKHRTMCQSSPWPGYQVRAHDLWLMNSNFYAPEMFALTTEP